MDFRQLFEIEINSKFIHRRAEIPTKPDILSSLRTGVAKTTRRFPVDLLKTWYQNFSAHQKRRKAPVKRFRPVSPLDGVVTVRFRT